MTTGRLWRSACPLVPQRSSPPHLAHVLPFVLPLALWQALVMPSDVALEVGCAGGKTTDALGRRALVAYGVDKSSDPYMHEQQQEHTRRHVKFFEANALDLDTLTELSKRAAREAQEVHEGEATQGRPDALPSERVPSGFSVVLVDLSGSARLAAVLEAVERYEACFRSSLRLIIVKNYRLACFLDRTRPFEATHA